MNVLVEGQILIQIDILKKLLITHVSAIYVCYTETILIGLFKISFQIDTTNTAKC